MMTMNLHTHHHIRYRHMTTMDLTMMTMMMHHYIRYCLMMTWMCHHNQCCHHMTMMDLLRMNLHIRCLTSMADQMHQLMMTVDLMAVGLMVVDLMVVDHHSVEVVGDDPHHVAYHEVYYYSYDSYHRRGYRYCYLMMSIVI
jgi:hypothetical protein